MPVARPGRPGSTRRPVLVHSGSPTTAGDRPSGDRMAERRQLLLLSRTTAAAALCLRVGAAAGWTSDSAPRTARVVGPPLAPALPRHSGIDGPRVMDLIKASGAMTRLIRSLAIPQRVPPRLLARQERGRLPRGIVSRALQRQRRHRVGRRRAGRKGPEKPPKMQRKGRRKRPEKAPRSCRSVQRTPNEPRKNRRFAGRIGMGTAGLEPATSRV